MTGDFEHRQLALQFAESDRSPVAHGFSIAATTTHATSTSRLADAMGVVATENGWQIEQTSDDLIQVLPIA